MSSRRSASLLQQLMAARSAAAAGACAAAGQQQQQQQLVVAALAQQGALCGAQMRCMSSANPNSKEGKVLHPDLLNANLKKTQVREGEEHCCHVWRVSAQ